MPRPVLAGLLFALSLVTIVLLARADPLDDERGHRARAIADNVMSPFCPGMTLAACTSPAASEWRADIRKWVDQGLEDQEIRQRLEQRAGRDLSGTPRSSFGWLAPVAITLVSVGLLSWLLYRWARPRPEPKPVKLDASLDARLEAALDRELEREEP